MQHLKLNSSPRQNGEIHGKTLRKEIHDLARIRRALVKKYLKSYSPQQIEDLALAQVEALKKYPRFFEEFDGISQGAEIGHADLLILNNYTDIRDFSPDDDTKKEELGGCSVFAIKNSRGLIAGQTWDMDRSAYPYVIHMTVEQPHANAKKSEIISIAGCLGLAGVNSEGVTVCINNLHCRDTHIALMWPALVRGMLEEPSAKLALAYTEKNLPCSGHNYLIADAEEAINLETTGLDYEVTEHLKSTGTIFHVNHYVGRLKRAEIKARVSSTTHGREKYLTSYFAENSVDTLTMDKLSRELLTECAPNGICFERGDSNAATCGGLIYDQATRTGKIFHGIYGQGAIHPIK